MVTQQSEIIGKRGESISVVEDITGVILLGNRALRSELLRHSTNLQDVLILRIVTVAHLHVEHTTKRVGIVSIERGSEEVAIANNVCVERTNHSEVGIIDIVEVVRSEHFNALDSVLQHLRCITMYGNSITIRSS